MLLRQLRLRTQDADEDGQPSVENEQKTLDLFVSQTDGLTLRAMRRIVEIAVDQSVRAKRIDDAVRSYRVGVSDNPWRQDTCA